MIAAQTGDERGVIIGDGASIAPNAQLEGPLALAPGVQVGDCVLGPAVCVGEGACVGDGSALAHSTVFAGARLGECCELEYAIVEENAELSAGTRAQGTPDEPTILGADDGP